MNAPDRVSGKSDREAHQEEFKKQLLQFYQCSDPINPNVAKCMVLNKYFSKSQITGSHIIRLEKRQQFLLMGLSRAEVWNVKNGLLLYKPIEEKFDSQDLVILFDYFFSNNLNYFLDISF